MPYIQEGSIERYQWTSENISLLKNLVIHTILSLASAFDKIGFYHGDLHLGNVLFKKTKIQEIEYNFENNQRIVVPTAGYKVVIMDFEKSELDVKNPQYFWSDIKTLVNRVHCIQNDRERVKWDNNIQGYIDVMIDEVKPVDNVLKLIKIIDKSKLEVVKLQPLTYNPLKF